MNSKDYEKVKVLGELISSQKDRVDYLINDKRFSMPKEAAEFSKELIRISKGRRITSADVDRVYEDKYKSLNDNKEYRIIAEVIKNYSK